MKKSLLVIVLGVLVAGTTFAQAEETRSLPSFSRITVHQGIDVFIKEGNTEEARVVTKNVDLDEILTEVTGKGLKVYLEGNTYSTVDVEVYVTYRSIHALGASSGASVTAEGEIEVDGDVDVDVSSGGDVAASIRANKLSIEASSGGDVVLKVQVDEIVADVSSGGNTAISGTTCSQGVKVSSSGGYYGYDLESERVDASASSGGSIKVNVSNKIKGKASSGGSVRYKGTPKHVNARSSSGGSVKKS